MAGHSARHLGAPNESVGVSKVGLSSWSGSPSCNVFALLFAFLLLADVAAADNDRARSISLTDVNRDGYLDLLDHKQGTDLTYLNDGLGRFALTRSAAHPESEGIAPAGDVDRDGDTDFVAVNGGRAVLFLNAGTNNHVEQPLDAGALATAVALGDVDNDGDLDVAVVSSGAPDRLLINRDAWGACSWGSSTCFDSIEIGQKRGNDSQAGALGDVDADGLLDFVVVGETSGRVYFGQPNGRDANPFTTPGIVFGTDRLRVMSMGATSKETRRPASYSPPPGHASCDPALPTGNGTVPPGSATKESSVAKVGDDQQIRDHGEPVVLNLIGPACMTVKQGIAFVDPGANAWTPVFGDLTDWIVVSNPVNTDLVGTYTVTYEVRDNDDYVARAWRTVYVEGSGGAGPQSGGGGGGGGGSVGLELWSLLLLALVRRRRRADAAIRSRSGLLHV
jgi:hypothetical protein